MGKFITKNIWKKQFKMYTNLIPTIGKLSCKSIERALIEIKSSTSNLSHFEELEEQVSPQTFMK